MKSVSSTVRLLFAEPAWLVRRGMGSHKELQRGFGLLEAIVAMVILGSSGLMLFSWLNSNLVTASRLKESEIRSQLRLEAQSWLLSLNPAIEPTGEKTLGSLRLRWRSDLVEPARDEYDYRGNLVPRWQIGLYRVHAEAMDTRSEHQVVWQQMIVGWRVRPDIESAQGAAVRP